MLRAPCMGRCDTAPVLEIGHNHIDHATPEKVAAAIAAATPTPDMPDYETFEAYRAAGRRLRHAEGPARDSGDPEEVQDTVLEPACAASAARASRRAANGPSCAPRRARATSPSMATRASPAPSRTATTSSATPHLFLEGMLIAAWAVEAETCFIYMRDEYPAVLEILRREIAALEAAGIVAPGYIDLRRGAGAYICGEESAMIESIEGKRGLPRHRPPYVAQVGVFGRPTLVHNVETLHWVARICREGPEVLNGTEKNGRTGCAPTRSRAGSEEAGRASAARGLHHHRHHRGGRRHARRAMSFKAYQPGGPSSGILPATHGRRAARLRHAAAAWHLHRLRRRRGAVGPGPRAGRRAEHAALLRGRKLRPVHPLPGRLREGGEADAGGPLGPGACSKISAR